MSSSGVEAIVSDYFARLRRALAPLPRSRRDQLLEDLREHVTMARAGLTEESELSVREIFEHLGAPEDIAAEALAASPRPPRRWRLAHGRINRRWALALATAAAVLAGGGTFAAIASSGPSRAPLRTDADVAPYANSDCSPQTNPATSGGSAAALTSKAVEVAHGTVAGHSWSLWSARGRSGANGLEEGGLLIGGRAYGLCPGFPNPAELELADVGPAGLVYGVIGYHGRAKVDLYKSTAGTFDQGNRLPAPSVTVVNGVSFFIGALPDSACDYSSLELNSTSPGVSAEHNLGFGHCTAGQLVPITASQGIWQLPPGQFPSGFGPGNGTGPNGGGAGGGLTGPAGFPAPDSNCSPQTAAATSGGPAATLTSKATEVAHGTVAGSRWSLWSARGQSGANGLEDGGLVIGGRAYGLCPGFPNPAELELANIGSGIVYGVIGYPGRAQVHLYTSTDGTFDRGTQLPTPAVTVVSGVSFFIGTVPKSACDYPSLELNATANAGSSQHNLGFGSCVSGKLVTITDSMGEWSVGR
jgi:hypothetical protein